MDIYCNHKLVFHVYCGQNIEEKDIYYEIDLTGNVHLLYWL